MFTNLNQLRSATPDCAQSPQACETIGEIVNHLQELAIQIASQSNVLACAIGGPVPVGEAKPSQPPQSLPDHLREIRASLNYSASELARVRQILGA